MIVNSIYCLTQIKNNIYICTKRSNQLHCAQIKRLNKRNKYNKAPFGPQFPIFWKLFLINVFFFYIFALFLDACVVVDKIWKKSIKDKYHEIYVLIFQQCTVFFFNVCHVAVWFWRGCFKTILQLQLSRLKTQNKLSGLCIWSNAVSL